MELSGGQEDNSIISAVVQKGNTGASDKSSVFSIYRRDFGKRRRKRTCNRLERFTEETEGLRCILGLLFLKSWMAENAIYQD